MTLKKPEAARVHQSLSSEASYADPLILPSSTCQAHASQSASHGRELVWKPHTEIGIEQCLCWIIPESISELHPVPIYIFWRWGNQTCRVFKTQGSHRFIQSQRSQQLPLLLPQYCTTFDSLLSSEHLANNLMELISLSCFLFLDFWPAIYPQKALSLHDVAA